MSAENGRRKNWTASSPESTATLRRGPFHLSAYLRPLAPRLPAAPGAAHGTLDAVPRGSQGRRFDVYDGGSITQIFSSGAVVAAASVRPPRPFPWACNACR